jgi:hypothetical protein
MFQSEIGLQICVIISCRVGGSDFRFSSTNPFNSKYSSNQEPKKGRQKQRKLTSFTFTSPRPTSSVYEPKYLGVKTKAFHYPQYATGILSYGLHFNTLFIFQRAVFTKLFEILLKTSLFRNVLAQ